MKKRFKMVLIKIMQKNNNAFWSFINLGSKKMLSQMNFMDGVELYLALKFLLNGNMNLSELNVKMTSIGGPKFQ